MALVRAVFRYTLNNVVFGITLMVLVGAYIAIGSGFPGIRSYFELSDLDFFDAWPLKVLMALLCANLAVVTWNRIPLTPPRYGVWCIHSGIITLIAGMSLYYHFKVEGRTLIQLGHTANVFYDTNQRSLYARVMNQPMFAMTPLPSLPRFASYPEDAESSALNDRDLVGIDKMYPLPVADSPRDLGSMLGLNQKLRLGVIGYYPYANLVEDVSEDQSSNDVGVELSISSSNPAMGANRLTLCSTDPAAAKQVIGATELEHRNVAPESLAMIRESAAHIFRVTATLPNHQPLQVDVPPGKPVELSDWGYTITAQSADPAFRTIGTQQVLPEMMLHVVSHSPVQPQEFWRSILQGTPLQTDFKWDPATTRPMAPGNRQATPIDSDLVLNFNLDDPSSLLPVAGEDKHLFLTSGASDLLDIESSYIHGVNIRDLSQGGQLNFNVEGNALTAAVRRIEHVKLTTRVVEVPQAQRQKDVAEAGDQQVIVVRVTCGNWSENVCVPFAQYPAADPSTGEPTTPWAMGIVKIPGASYPIQLQLGNTCRPMPAALTLRKFELVHYPGGTGDEGPYRDFRSTLEITDANQERSVEVASLNSPIYFDGGKWIFFQASYDPNAQFTVMGVGNRPGVAVMICGCVMVVLGLMYTFYVKPAVVRRMKAKALARAAAQKTRIVEQSVR